MRKLWTFLFFRQLEHLLEKNDLLDALLNPTCNFFKIKIPLGLVYLLEQSHHWN